MQDYSNLFEEPLSVPPFSSLREEFEALSDGKKGMAYHLFLREELRKGSSRYEELVKLASEFDLSIVHRNDHRHSGSTQASVRVFFLRPEQSWRIHAFETLWDATEYFTWSDGFEFLQGQILGYTKAQTIHWMEELRSLRVGWASETLIIITTEHELEKLRETAFRAFPPSCKVSTMTALFCNQGDRLLRSKALEALPAQSAILRIAVDIEKISEIWPSRSELGNSVLSAPLRMSAQALNLALRSRIEVFNGAWPPAPPSRKIPNE